eukprot:2829473-Amphidinium_carterae.1
MCEITGNTIPQADADRWDDEEMKKVLDLGTLKATSWEAVPHLRCIGTRFMRDSNKQKSRLVVQHVRKGGTRPEDYSPTPSLAGLSLTDISSAFLYAELPEELRVLVTLPTTQPGATDDEGVRIPYLVVLKSLYGLRVAPALWSKHLGSTLRKLGYRRSQLDPGVFWKSAIDGDGKEDPEKCYYIV